MTRTDTITSLTSAFLSKPKGNWPETSQAYGQLTDAMLCGYSPTNKPLYRLPNGRATVDADHAVSAWTETVR